MRIRFKAKIKNCQLTVRAKLPFWGAVNEQEVTLLSRCFLRGLLKPKLVRKNVVDYVGPMGITLSDRLSKPITRHDFFFIIEQIVDVTEKLRKNNLSWKHVIWDIRKVFINEATKEMQFIYLPVDESDQFTETVMDFIERIIYSAKPIGDSDADFVSRFSYALRSMNGFDPEKIEGFIMREDPSIVNTIRKHRAGSSGFMTDKRQDYYKHYDEPGSAEAPDEEATGLLFDDEQATCLLDEGTQLLSDAEETSLLVEESDHYPELFRVSKQETVSINKPVFRIGKEKSYVDYFIPDNCAVSRSHADIITRGTRFFVIDLNSKNKTFINGQAISAGNESELFDGDQLMLGNEAFIFRA